MNPTAATPETPRRNIGDVSVVLIQHWAEMITGLQEREAAAREQARICQHQVHVLHRNNNDLDLALGREMARAQALEEQLQAMCRFTVNALMWNPDMSENHFLAREYNRLVGEFNGTEMVLETDEELSDEE